MPPNNLFCPKNIDEICEVDFFDLKILLSDFVNGRLSVKEPFSSAFS